MAGVHLDPNGRLLRLYAIPPPRSGAPPTPDDPGWFRWFDPKTLGFDLEELRPARPDWTPPCACDQQAAWTRVLPDRPDVPVRVEAAAYRGRPVYFEVMPALWEVERVDRRPDVVLLALLAGVIVLAVRNLRRGRGDVRGAVRSGLAILAVTAGAWLVGCHHTPSREISQLAAVLGVGGLPALLYGLSYLAMEPAVRRRWPWRITAWNRLLDGRLRDPMVGRDLLIGMALGAAVLLVLRVGWLTATWAGVSPIPLTGTGPFALQIPGPPTPLYVLLSFLTVPIFTPVLYLVLSFLLFLVLRREWLAWGRSGCCSWRCSRPHFSARVRPATR
jgi:hypothetical protein